MTSHITPEAHYFQERWRLSENPFRVSSAEHLDEADILRLFVADSHSSLAAFSFNVNNIIRGIYGSGKTMCLRAVESFAFSQAIVDLVESGRTPVLPVRVNLAEIGHLHDSDTIYKAIVLRVFRSLMEVSKTIERHISANSWFPTFREWRHKLTKSGIYAHDTRYELLSADEVVARAKQSFTAGAKFPGAALLQLLARSESEHKFTARPSPSIVDINEFHRDYLAHYCDRILLLFDEVGSLNPDFFVTKGAAPSGYETLMNQLRTSTHLYYKLCVYPGHYSDALQEARYGTRINLDYSVTDKRAFGAYALLCDDILQRYIRAVQSEGDTRNIGDFFEHSPAKIENPPYDCIKGRGSAFEQLCFASGGVLRRLFSLSSKAMLVAANEQANPPIVTRNVAFTCLEQYGNELVNRHSSSERSQLAALSQAYSLSNTFRFTSELDAESLLKPFTSKTQQDSVLNDIGAAC